MPVICFSCLKQIDTTIYRAFDKNFCSNLCRKNTIEVNEFLDVSFIDPYKWINSIDEIKIVKKEVREKKVKKECRKLINNLIDDIFKNDTVNTNNIQGKMDRKDNQQHNNIKYFYHVHESQSKSRSNSFNYSNEKSNPKKNRLISNLKGLFNIITFPKLEIIIYANSIYQNLIS